MVKIIGIFINKLKKEEVKFMKKLLLLSLLIMGVESFASVIGNDVRAEIPIVVKGTIIPKNGTNLVIEPTENASEDGSSIELNFGGVTKGTTSQSATGKFIIRRESTSKVIHTDTTKIKVGMLNGIGTSVGQNAYVNPLGGLSGLSANYAVNSSISGDKTQVTGTVSVALVAAETTPTRDFLDNSQKLGIIVRP